MLWPAFSIDFKWLRTEVDLAMYISYGIMKNRNIHWFYRLLES
jgi:hypothetical protein